MTALGKRREPTRTYAVAGPLCYEGDVLSLAKELPASLAVGDVLALHDTGAYTVSRSTNFIRSRAGVVAVDGDRWELCWRAETIDDVFAFAVDPEKA